MFMKRVLGWWMHLCQFWNAAGLQLPNMLSKRKEKIAAAQAEILI